MKLTKEIANLICDLEYRLGSNCTQNNRFAADLIEYRYPVCMWVDDPNDEEDYGHHEKIKMNVRYKYEDVDGDSVRTFHYKIGSNKLNVGIALIEMLNMLEQRYNIDFNDLEEKNGYPSLKINVGYNYKKYI